LPIRCFGAQARGIMARPRYLLALPTKPSSSYLLGSTIPEYGLCGSTCNRAGLLA